MADEAEESATQAKTEDAAAAATATAEPDLRAELEAARAKADEHYRSWQRSAADFANFKRRVDDEKRFAERWLLQDLLPVLDDFERAWGAVPRELLKLTWLEGVLQINSKLFAVLERHGVTPIETQGKEFSPLEHEAVMRDEEGDPAEQTAIVAELQRGYRLHERVLRPALVKVGKPNAQAAQGAETAPSAESAPSAEGAPPAESPPSPQ
jgi:molecular chaperone GrpE